MRSLNRHFLPILLVIAIAVFVGCGHDQVPEGDARVAADAAADEARADGTPAEGLAADLGEPSTFGLVLPGMAHQTGDLALQLGTESVFAASILATEGREIVVVGTLTQAADGRFTYDALPTDRLRVTWADGEELEFFVYQLQGDFSEDADRFLNRDHAANIRVRASDALDVTSSSHHQGGGLAESFVGFFRVGEVRHTFNLQRTGTYRSQVDGSFAEYDSSVDMRGEIANEVGLSMDVQESDEFALVSFENTVIAESRTIHTQWVDQGHRYSMANARIQTESLNGWANPSDYWVARGEVLRDGQPTGSLDFEATDAWISILLRVGAERYELERYLLRQGG